MRVIEKIKSLIIPSVSIFWYIPEFGDAGLLNFTTKYTDVLVPDELSVVTSEFDHVSLWEDIIKVETDLSFFEYDDFPRGRVNLNIGKIPFEALILASPKILQNIKVMSQIKKECNINHLKVECKRDNHYL